MKKLLYALILVYTASISMGAAPSISPGIDVWKQNNFSIEDCEYAKKIVPQYSVFLDEMITAVKQAKAFRYDIHIWARPYDEQATSATLYKPNGSSMLLNWNTSKGKFDFESDEGESAKSYFTIGEFAADFPAGQYRIDVTFVSSGIKSCYITIPDYDTTLFPDMPDANLSLDGSGKLILNWSAVQGIDEYNVWAYQLYVPVEVYSNDIALSYPQSTSTPLNIYKSSGNYNIGITAYKPVGDGVDFVFDKQLFSFKPKTFGIIIGINDASGVRGDISASNVYDALKAFDDWAGAEFGNTSAPMYSLPSKTELANILNAMDIKEDSNDQIIFYYCGHGQPAKNDGGEIPPCTLPDELLIESATNFISDDELANVFDSITKLKNIQKVFILDACYSGGFVGADPVNKSDLDKLSHCILLASATETSKAFAYPPGDQSGTTGTGIWTNYLLPKLEKTTGISWLEIKNYMEAQRSELMNKYGTRTLPVLGEPGEVALFEWNPFFWYSSDVNPNEPIFGKTAIIGDFTGDRIVNFLDLAKFASYWQSYNPTFDIMPQPYGDRVVDVNDLAEFSRHWLEGDTISD